MPPSLSACSECERWENRWLNKQLDGYAANLPQESTQILIFHWKKKWTIVLFQHLLLIYLLGNCKKNNCLFRFHWHWLQSLKFKQDSFSPKWTLLWTIWEHQFIVGTCAVFSVLNTNYQFFDAILSTQLLLGSLFCSFNPASTGHLYAGTGSLCFLSPMLWLLLLHMYCTYLSQSIFLGYFAKYHCVYISKSS